MKNFDVLYLSLLNFKRKNLIDCGLIILSVKQKKFDQPLL